MHFDDSKNDAVRLITFQKFDGKGENSIWNDQKIDEVDNEMKIFEILINFWMKIANFELWIWRRMKFDFWDEIMVLTPISVSVMSYFISYYLEFNLKGLILWIFSQWSLDC